MKNMELFRAFVLKATGIPLDAMQPVMLSGWEVVEALWPLNERFRHDIHQIGALPYDAGFEAEADAAIVAAVMEAPGSDWSSLSAGAWRVLLERQQQAITVAAVNEMAGNPLMPVPSELPTSARTGAAMLFLLHEMKLPFPAEDRSGFELPAGAAPATLRRH